jgi:hypothetical protein
MRLLLETEDRDPYWLVGDPTLNERTDQSAGMSEQIQVTRNQQVVTGAGWDSALGLDRGNQQVTITATTRRQFDSEKERMDFIAELAATNPSEQLHRWAGTVTVSIDELADDTLRNYVLPNATVSLVGMVLGAAVGLNLTYQVRAGGFGERSTSGQGETFNLVATDAGGIWLEIDDGVMNSAITAALAASSNGVVELGMYRQTINATTGAIGTPALRGGTILFFADATAYDDYLGSDRSLYEALNVGRWNLVSADGITFYHRWSINATWSGGLKGCAGFTLPFSNARQRMLKQPVAPQPTVFGGVPAFGPPSAGMGEVRESKLILNTVNDGEPGTNARLWTLRLTRQQESSSGVVSYVLGDPIATFDFSFPGTVNLTANSTSGTIYQLTGFIA